MSRNKQQMISRSRRQWFYFLWVSLLSTLSLSPAMAVTPEVTFSVWVNEAIVSVYTFGEKNLLERQKEIAKYFTAQGWINFSKAMDTSKLKETVQQNHYTASAVALLPPTLKHDSPDSEWQATMPLMVVYKNHEYQQKQTLQVVITFAKAKPGTGVRGLAISSFNATVTTPPCQCERQHGTKTIV